MEGTKTIAGVHPVDVIHHPAALRPSPLTIQKLRRRTSDFWIGSFIGIITALIALLSVGPITRQETKPLSAIQWQEYWNRSDMQMAFAEQSAIRSIELRDGGRSTISKNLEQLEPQFRARVVALLDQLEKDGHPFSLLEGYRSPERQAALFAKEGATVTLAAPFQSKHQFGLAADFVAIKDGGPSFDVNDPTVFQAYQQLGKTAESLGLVWGGRWNIGDYGHIESATAIASLYPLNRRN